MDCTLLIFTNKTVQPQITKVHVQPTYSIHFIFIDPFVYIYGVCYRITATIVKIFEDLSSNQEEADTKLLLHTILAVLSDLVGPSLYNHRQAMST